MTLLRDRPDWQLLCGLVVGLVVFSAWLTHTAGFELHYDEAQYWEWSQHLDWSYYSKGPLLAWLIALSESLFGHGEWQVRLFAWFTHGIFLVLVFGLTRLLWHSRTAAWWGVMIALTTPLYFTLGLVMTTDVFLFAFWTWGLWAAQRALYQNRKSAWYELGAAVGIGSLVKLSIGLLPAAIGLLVMVMPHWRRHLLNPHVWSGLALMLACMSPMLLWNFQNDWVMFRHELGHVGHQNWSLTRLIEFLLGQWLALSPIVVVIAITVLRRLPVASHHRLLWLVSLACTLFFIFKAGGDKVQLNWPAPAYIGFIVLFAGTLPNLSAPKQRLLLSGIITSVIFLAIGSFPYQFGLSARYDPLKEVKSWRQPIATIAATAPPVDFILTDKYELAAELSFYWPVTLPVYITGNANRRFNQHDLWPTIDRESGHDALFISTRPEPPPELARAFHQSTVLPPAIARAPDGSPLRTLYVRHCLNYVSILWPSPQVY